MRLAQFSSAGRNGIGCVTEDGILDLRGRLPREITTLIELIAHWDEMQSHLDDLATCAPDLKLQDVVLRAPISRPGKIMCIGLNYADHAAEASMDLPKDQLWFSKPATAISDPYGGVQLPRVSEALDYEAELIFVIGKKVRHASRDEATNAIFGYSIGNDVSVRDWQFKTSQFILGKILRHPCTLRAMDRHGRLD
jgi:2-keto-4-pentenoate hydratase/2-oxohepta-3-ene-1,7-dioic acid hydratase in catechol pathway